MQVSNGTDKRKEIEKPEAQMIRINVQDVGKVYSTGTVALENIDLAIEDGEFVSVLGPSGCGKSTLLRIMASLDHATSGKIDIVGSGIAAKDALPFAVVFQEVSIYPWMKVRDNIEFAFDSLSMPRAEVRKRVDQQLELVGLSKFAKAYPHQLSGGMKQRVAVARAFAVDPPVLFMDEPFGSLDEQTRVGLAGELLQIWERTRKTVVFVTHGIEEAVSLADRVVVLSKSPGRIKEIIPIDFPRPRDPVKLRGEPKFGEYVVRIWDLLR
ncbi:MAG TPA: ABC transporter ATP-binding protein [Candidatus Binatia bacterium]|nr:ABC transporter ATP-binding protein [Candidatus Binatia bacterium]